MKAWSHFNIIVVDTYSNKRYGHKRKGNSVPFLSFLFMVPSAGFNPAEGTMDRNERNIAILIFFILLPSFLSVLIFIEVSTFPVLLWLFFQLQGFAVDEE